MQNICAPVRRPVNHEHSNGAIRSAIGAVRPLAKRQNLLHGDEETEVEAGTRPRHSSPHVAACEYNSSMKETERSLRWYLLLAGVIAALTAMRDIDSLKSYGGVLTTGQMAALYIPIVTRLLLGAAFVVAGVKLPSALLTGAGWIKTMLVISGAALLLDGAIVTAVFGGAGQSGIVGAAVGIAITAYLHHSVTRLAAEAAIKASLAAPLPQSRVV
jgi:hypothetical protein